MSFLCFQNWREISVFDEENHYHVRAAYEPEIRFCPRCGSENIKKNKYEKKFLKDAPVRGKAVTISVTYRTYYCSDCEADFRPEIPQLVEGSRLTRRLIVYLVNEAIKKNYAEVSRDTGVSESLVREVFTRFVELNSHLLPIEAPRVLGIDEVYIARVARCILTDIENKRPFDLLPYRTLDVVYDYLRKMRNRQNVEVVTIDMCRTFNSAARDAFPDAKRVIDTFHVQRNANQSISNFLSGARMTLNIRGRREKMHDRFLLLKRSYNLIEEEKIMLENWKSKWPELAEVYDLKEEFFMIWRLSKRSEAEEKYRKWKTGMSATARRAFYDMISTIENWHEEIFNYFDFRYTNAYTESCNNLIKRLHAEGRGYDFETVRAKILFRYAAGDLTEKNVILTNFVGGPAGLTKIRRLAEVREGRGLPLFP